MKLKILIITIAATFILAGNSYTKCNKLYADFAAINFLPLTQRICIKSDTSKTYITYDLAPGEMMTIKVPTHLITTSEKPFDLYSIFCEIDNKNLLVYKNPKYDISHPSKNPFGYIIITDTDEVPLNVE